MRLRRYRPVVLLLLVLHLGACGGWRPSPVPPRQLIEGEQPGLVRVIRNDGTVERVRDPRIVNDSIATVEDECQPVAGRRFACVDEAATMLVALNEVAWLEVPRLDVLRSLALIVAVPVVAMGACVFGLICEGLRR